MAKKKSPILKIFILFVIIEVILVIVSNGFNKQLQIGFDDGKIIFRNIQSHYDLQERITEEFQIDEHYRQTGETPEIYRSNKIYEFFKSVFGKASAIGTFQLLRMLLIVDILLLFLAFLIKKKLLKRPSQPQILFELTYSTLEQFVIETIGKDKVNFTPYIVTLFLFIWVSNMIGMIPIPGFMEPTRNLNVPLGLGIFAVAIVHITAFKVKGAWGHLQNYLNPIKNPLFLLDIIGEISKVVSISFRLFGNILGGAIIILVISSLVSYVVFPVGLTLFFGIFVGTIQAFVFTMLALTYIGVEISE
ncbi:MAG: F0F1 ATP synthase subunit A [Candidatus Cloacimonetes bacterium]|jgi:F-type H+-transporting ATPase subunit a|nr:F0F1 ATP synthase subunit A [Candidatus Cloacimonadota bacterium]